MLFLPYSSALHLAKKPLVTYAVIILCVIIHQLQWNNRTEIKKSASSYCFKARDAADKKPLDYLAAHPVTCTSFLTWKHEQPGRQNADKSLQHYMEKNSDFSAEGIRQAMLLADSHYQMFSLQVPQSLDGQLIYFPDTLDVFRMLTAALAHADWLHLIGNLLFFFAFAPGVEGVIGNKLKYLAVLLGLVVITHVAYAVYSLPSSQVVPTLGLSGVVMGVIGASAYLMPNARIKVLIWGYRFVNTYYIPAWILAVIYIGWDTIKLYTLGNSSGVNLVAHVSGGFAGYLLALVFFRERRRATKDELAEEVNYQVSRKKDGHSYDLSSTYGRERRLERIKVKQSQREHDALLQKLYTLTTVRNDHEAIALLTEDEALYRQDTMLLEEMFGRMQEWGKSKTLLCTGRWLIDLWVSKQQYAKAINVLKKCQEYVDAFVLADPGMAALLFRYAIEMHEYQAAYLLVHDTESRYTKNIDHTLMQLREAEVCLFYLDKHEQGQQVLKKLLHAPGAAHKEEILALAMRAKKIQGR